MYGIYDYGVVTHTHARTRTHTHTHARARARTYARTDTHNLWQPAPTSLFYLQQDYPRHVWDIDIVDQTMC